MESTYLRKPDKPTEQTAKREVHTQIVWPKAIGILFFHLTALYGLYVSIASAKLLTWVYGKLRTYTLYIYIYKNLYLLLAHLTTDICMMQLYKLERLGKKDHEC